MVDSRWGSAAARAAEPARRRRKMGQLHSAAEAAESAHVAGGESAAAAATAAVSLQAGCDSAPVGPWVDQGGPDQGWSGLAEAPPEDARTIEAGERPPEQ